MRLLRRQRRRKILGKWLGTLALVLLAASTCPAFDLLDFGPKDLDPNDWSAEALVGLPPDPEVVDSKPADHLNVTTLRPVAFTLSDGYAYSLAGDSCSLRRSPEQDFPTWQRRIVRQICHAHERSTATSGETAIEPA